MFIHVLINALPLVILTIPLLIATSLLYVFPLFIAVSLMPVTFVLAYIITAGLPTIPCHSHIKKGRFIRNAQDKTYRFRMIYGKCWSMIYYFPPLYQLILHVPILKWLTFRIFGYRGNLSFTTYPDTWIRDLPCLSLGKGAYLSNRATIGTNIVQKTGHILVDGISVGDGSVIGHLAIIGPGAKIGNNSEIGVGCIIGIRTRIRENVVVKPGATVYHASLLEDGVVIEPEAYIGVHCIIRKGITVPAGVIIPDGTIINTTEDLKKFDLVPRNVSRAVKGRPQDLIRLKK